MWNHKITLVLLAILWVTGLSAQTAATTREKSRESAFELIRRNRNFSASNYCIYPDSTLGDLTPAPDGKVPFYISHYGRHGSRYLGNRKGYDIPLNMMLKADSMGLLTTEGKEVLRQLQEILADSEGRWGDLTGLGKKQHRQIAKRMAERFPEVFSDPKSVVMANSTIVSRCILSMGSAVQQLASMYPNLQIVINASQNDMWYMNHQDSVLRTKSNAALKDPLYKKFSDPLRHNPRLMGILFTNPDSVKKVVSEEWLNYYLLKTALIQQNTHMDEKSSLIDLFSYEDFHCFWQQENAWWYVSHGPYLPNGGRQPYSQRYLLRHIIDDAEQAMQRPTPSSALRFGHETIVLPLTCLMGINGFDFETDNLEELERNGWWACLVFPMASNIQLIFYRSSPKDDDVLVKVLLNEQEATLPFQTDVAPYYHWKDFREYYTKKINDYERQQHMPSSASPSPVGH